MSHHAAILLTNFHITQPPPQRSVHGNKPQQTWVGKKMITWENKRSGAEFYSTSLSPESGLLPQPPIGSSHRLQQPYAGTTRTHVRSYDLIIQGFRNPSRTILPAKHSFSDQGFRLWKVISDADLSVAAIGICEALVVPCLTYWTHFGSANNL